ncbi:MAG: hypothetical protein SVV03_00055, partial [Candidatus Nanohaloarchaea archaeon]|nr:hypothetical protein [Candidatus Nanohaloarchaea archaeon]
GGRGLIHADVRNPSEIRGSFTLVLDDVNNRSSAPTPVGPFQDADNYQDSLFRISVGFPNPDDASSHNCDVKLYLYRNNVEQSNTRGDVPMDKQSLNLENEPIACS